MTYVDDLLIGALSVRGVDDVRESLEQTLKVKQTGFVTNSQGDGGILKFLGKEITRPKGSSNLFLRVPPSYLEDLFVNEPFCSELRATTRRLSLNLAMKQPPDTKISLES